MSGVPGQPVRGDERAMDARTTLMPTKGGVANLNGV